MKKLFVGNLSWKTSEDNLKTLFEKFGAVTSVRIIVDQYTGKSKGFGFVEMETPEAAQKAIAELNEKPFMERNIRVSSALERTDRGPGGNGGGGGQRERPPREHRGDRDRDGEHRRQRSNY